MVDREGRQRGGEGERRVWGGVGSRGVDIRQTEGWGGTEKGGGWGGKEGVRHRGLTERWGGREKGVGWGGKQRGRQRGQTEWAEEVGKD